MGRPLVQFAESASQNTTTYVCSTCSCDVASTTAVVWEGLTSVVGTGKPAFLFVKTSSLQYPTAERQEHLTSGVFLLKDVSCRGCGTVLGWRYLKSFQRDQAHKEGQTLVEQAKLVSVAVSNEPPQRPYIC